MMWYFVNLVSQGSPFAVFLYDTVYLYAMLAHEALEIGVSPTNGSFLLELAKQKVIEGN